MSYSFMRGCSVALLGVFAARGALAGVTAEDVWSEWRDYLTGIGYEVSGTETMSGGTLTVSDLVLSMTVPDDAGEMSLTAPKVAFSENGDGTVSVILPESLPVRFRVTDGEEVTGEISISQSRPEMVVSGDPGDMTYSYATAKMDMSLASLSVDGAPVPEDVMRFDISIADVKTESRVLIGKARTYSQTMSAGSVSYDMAFRDPQSEDAGSFRGNLKGVTFEGTGKLPLTMDSDDFQALLGAGFGFDGTFSYAESSSEVAARGDGEEFSYAGSSKGGSLRVAMDAGRAAYEMSQKAPSVNMLSSEFPVPITISLAELGFSLDMPVVKSEAEQPFSFGVTLAELILPDVLWGIFDPGGTLPRDPASLIVDIAGKVQLFQDLLDPEAAMMMEKTGTPPGQVTAVSIRRLLVSAVGAKLSGTGDFTLDNSDLKSFGGMPRPAGAAKLRVEGANALMDKLIQMGIVSDEDAMGARMMLGMLTVPGEAPDTMNSTIEINEQGQIFANGQRIK